MKQIITEYARKPQEEKKEMLILIVDKFFNEKTNRWEELVDYAVDSQTGLNVCVPSSPIGSFPGAKYHQDMGEWVLE